MKKNKKKILAVFIVIAIVLFGHSSALAQAYQIQEKIPGYEDEPATDITQYIEQIVGFGIATIGILAMFMLIIGAYQYLMAAGNIGTMENARQTIASALLGLILGICAYLILYTINPNLVRPSLQNLQQFGKGEVFKPGQHSPIPLKDSIREKVLLYKQTITEASKKYGVPENIIKAMIDTESSGNRYAESNKGAKGLMQLMPGTARDMGVSDPFDPYQNIMGGTKYVSQMYKTYGNGSWERALAAYDWGPGNLQKNGMSRMPSETRNYISSVLGKAQSYT